MWTTMFALVGENITSCPYLRRKLPVGNRIADKLHGWLTPTVANQPQKVSSCSDM